MNEQLLQYIWNYQYFNKRSLRLDNDDLLDVIFPGKYNTDQGQSFLEAKIKIGDNLWVGNVKLYLKTTDLIIHQIQSNLKDDKVILYVVWEDDQPKYISQIPIFFLQSRVTHALLQQLENCNINDQSLAVIEPVAIDNYFNQNENLNGQKPISNKSINENDPGYNREGQDSIEDQLNDELKIINCLNKLKSSLRKKTPLINGKIRSLKIIAWQRETVRFYVKYGGHAKHVPKILLLGNWLTKAGFDCDTRVNVIPLTNMLIIIPEKK